MNMDSINQAYVNVEIINHVAIIEFFHPSHNSLPSSILKKLSETISSCGSDPSVFVIVIKSGGDRTYCAGASFDELVAIENEDQGKRFFMGFANVINAIRTCGKIVVGRIQGKAVGGGVGLASAMDYSFATKFAAIRLSELAVGIGPFVIGPAVERKVGNAAFAQMALDPKGWYSADWAQNRGMYSEVFEDSIAMDKRLNNFVSGLVEMNPESLSELKQVFWEGTENWDSLLSERAGTSGRLILSDFAKTTIKSFLNS